MSEWKPIETAPKDGVCLFWLDWAKDINSKTQVHESEKLFMGKNSGQAVKRNVPSKNAKRPRLTEPAGRRDLPKQILYPDREAVR